MAPHSKTPKTKKKKHYRPPGKKKEGNAAKYITREKARRYLQIGLPVFRKLCIIKGVFPRDPKKKVEGNHKTYYHMKDIQFLAHDPLIQIFRDIRAHRKKIKKAESKKNRDLVSRLEDRLPIYTLDKVIRARYPTFIDALRDLDDCLTMVHLFAALPAIEGERVNVERIHNCRKLSHQWQAYISRTHKLRKTFISVKGIYYQAEVEGQKITWLTPHALQQIVTDDVDFNVMLTFLEVYEALLGFVNYKLYHSINVEYPPILDPQLEALANDLYGLYREIAARSQKASGDSQVIESSGVEPPGDDKRETQPSESDLRLAQLQTQLPDNKPGALMHLVEEISSIDDEDTETKECKNLFKSLKFFLSREVPRESLLFIIPAFGGVVSWEGDGSPFGEADEGITHQIVDRPTKGHKFLSREYVQPQWVYDCVNARIILPTEGYLIGRVPPPHLSPFVDNEAEGYVPEYAEMIKRLKDAARNHVLPLPGTDAQDFDDPHNLLTEGVLNRTEANEAAEKKRELMILENQYHNELKMELQGITYSASLSNKNAQGVSTTVKEDAEPDLAQIAEDVQNLSKVSMSRNKRRLYEAMQIGNKRKKDNINLLKERKKKTEANKTQ